MDYRDYASRPSVSNEISAGEATRALECRETAIERLMAYFSRTAIPERLSHKDVFLA
jgi:hypothetical protein